MDALEPGFMGVNFLNISFYCFPLREMAAYYLSPILLKREKREKGIYLEAEPPGGKEFVGGSYIAYTGTMFTWWIYDTA